MRCASLKAWLLASLKHNEDSKLNRMKLTKSLPLLLGQTYSTTAHAAHGDAGGTEAMKAEDWEPSW